MKLGALTCAPTAADADGIFLDHQITATGAQTLDGAGVSGGVVTLAAAQLVTFTSGAGDDVSAVTFTVVGTDPDGRAQSEDIVGPNAGAVTGTKYFKTITSVSASATTGVGVTVSAGWAITAVSPTLRANHRLPHFEVGIGCSISGTITFSAQVTYDDFEAGKAADQTYPANWFEHAVITAKSAATDGSQLFPVTAFRLRVTASTSGSVTGKFIQAGA